MQLRIEKDPPLGDDVRQPNRRACAVTRFRSGLIPSHRFGGGPTAHSEGSAIKSPPPKVSSQPFQYRLDPLSSAVYASLHLGCLLIFFSNEWLKGGMICLISYFVRIFALSAIYHRYFAHRSYRTSRPVQFILGLFGTLTVQRGPLWWAATHRVHHRYADHPGDLHDPRRHGFLYAHSLWFLDRRNLATDLQVVKDFARFPELRWLDDYRFTCRSSACTLALFSIF
jgi:fatty-acid desaturase